MKYHYIYFLILPILLAVSLMLPFTIDDYGTGKLDYQSGFDDEITVIIFFTPTLLATILLLIRNNITSFIGTFFYLISFILAGFMNYFLHFKLMTYRVGIGAPMVLVVMCSGFILGIAQSVKLTKVRQHKRKFSNDLLDFDNSPDSI